MNRLILVVILMAPGVGRAQSANEKVFPLFVDGTTAGLTYRSELKIVNANANSPILQCTLSQRGVSATFIGVHGAGYFPDVFDSSESAVATTVIQLDRFLPWEILRSTAQSPLRAGYVSLACNGETHAELQVSLLDRNGNKLGEANVQPASPGRSFEFLIDRRDGTRLGVAVANDSHLPGECVFIAKDEFGQEVDRVYHEIDAWTQSSIFVDELLHLPTGFVGTIEVLGLPGGGTYVAGLRFSGPVFTTVSPLVRLEEDQ